MGPWNGYVLCKRVSSYVLSIRLGSGPSGFMSAVPKVTVLVILIVIFGKPYVKFVFQIINIELLNLLDTLETNCCDNGRMVMSTTTNTL